MTKGPVIPNEAAGEGRIPQTQDRRRPVKGRRPPRDLINSRPVQPKIASHFPSCHRLYLEGSHSERSEESHKPRTSMNEVISTTNPSK